MPPSGACSGRCRPRSQLRLAVEIATYTALEDLASSVGDTKTARLALAGYDELDVGESRSLLNTGGDSRARRVASYERSHKNRSGVLDAVGRERFAA
jgi:hypothetical protein